MLRSSSSIAAQRLRRIVIAITILATVASAAACTALTPTPIKQYPPAPAFAPSPESLSDLLPTQKAGTTSLSTDLGMKGEGIDLSRLLNASQGGYSAMRNLHWLAGQAAQMSSMGLRQVRLDHVFDDSTYHVVRKDDAGKVVYNFTALDRVLIPLLDNGITPFISLSYMPSVLGSKLYGPPDSLVAWGKDTPRNKSVI